ncbi:MAG: ABC transporter permease [Pseudomonadota bacterium]
MSAPGHASLWRQLRHLSWPEWRHQPWRNLTALVAVVLGVALAFSVHLINESALSEFSAAVRNVNGQADFELRGQREGFDDRLYDRVSQHPQVALANPVIDIDTLAWTGRGGQRVPVRVLGIDALVAPALNPALLPQPAPGTDRLVMLQPDAVFVNDSARQQLGLPVALEATTTLRIQHGVDTLSLPVRGRVALVGEAVLVMDLAGVQTRFDWLGRLSHIDVRLRPGADREQVLRELDLPAGVRAVTPQETAQRVSNLSRAYRVNLTVLALVALFTGSFLVFSILSLSVARRTPQFALLGVLGLGARERLRLVLAESALLGLLGSALGLALGTGLAQTALQLLSGDLGGGYFPGVMPSLRLRWEAALLYGGLGVGAAVVGGWLPARSAQRLAPAQALKGLGGHTGPERLPWTGPLLIALGALLALVPPIGGMPLAAYAAVASLLLGGIACVPAGVAWSLSSSARFGPWLQRHPLALLATSRARHQRHTATIAVAGVVASLALSVALTVMVSSFRHAVVDWLDTVLPADVYVRTSISADSDNVFLPQTLVQAVSQLPGVARVETQRVLGLQLDPAQPAVVLMARPLPDPARSLPLVDTPLPPLPGEVNVYVSEAVVSLYGVQPGQAMTLPLPGHPAQRVQVRGVWRDYARQSGSVMMDAGDFERLSGDTRVNDLGLWLQPGAQADDVQQRVREAVRAQAGGVGQAPDESLIEFASPGEIRASSLRIFDRSFAVTYWLQAVAIGIGLFGVAASFSAQVLARRKEFGLLSHLGLTRRQILTLVAGEGAVWSATGTLLGLALGLGVSVVLVKVVNPQSFHWTMDLDPPWLRLVVLCSVVWVAGTLTAWLSARRTALRDVAQAVKEDW